MTVANGHIQRNEAHLPIVIAGGGCVGLFVAHLLTQSSIPNRIIVWTSLLEDLFQLLMS